MHSVGDYRPIKDFPGYYVNPYGDIHSESSGGSLRHSKTLQGDSKVTLYKDGERVTRSVRVLVAEAFVDPPFSEGAYTRYPANRVIILNNDKDDIRAENLAWRPVWFAQKYVTQFRPVYPESYYTRSVIDLNANVVYGSILEAGVTNGHLFADIYHSILTGDTVFPRSARYDWV